MQKSILRRIWQFIPVLLGITFFSFSLLYIAPSDPVTIRLSAGGVGIDPSIAAKMRTEMGLDRPFLMQYFSWLGNFLQGDLGRSYITDEAVGQKLWQALPYTLKMAGLSMLLTLLVSVPMGIFIAAKQNSKIDGIVRFIAFIINAIPNFIVGIGLMYLFAFKLNWIPILTRDNFIGMILPSLSLALVMSSRYVRQVRAATLDELNKDYVIGLRARGLSEHTILYKNVIKNVMLTVITLTGISVGSLLGGTVIIETIFNWPGVGHLIMDGILQRDYVLVQAAVVWMAISFMLINLIVDISYTWFNPKIKNI